MVSTAKVEVGIASFLDGEIIPKLPANGIERVLIGTTASLMIKKMSKTLMDNKTLKMLGVQNDVGDIDVDVLAEELKNNIPWNGVTIDLPVLGTMTFHGTDVDKLLEHIKKQ